MILVSNDTKVGGEHLRERIESKLEVETYLQRLRYSLDNNARIFFQEKRYVDTKREETYTNKYTMADLFPNENPVKVLKRELRRLTVRDYIRTVKDINRPNNSEMREFGKVYEGNKDVYIKIRVEVMKAGEYGVDNVVFVMSFHYSTVPFSSEMFPYAEG
ncbi:MAG: hypothetical protein IJZ34_12930 [Lachnospiraceae bacterium]|nr:hypothetical protein [Lachnospiraceae bacterium]